MRIPTGRVKPSDDLSDYSIGLIGPKGAGKSVLGAAFPAAKDSETPALVARFEPGRENLEIRQIPEKATELLTWGDFEQACSAIVDQGETRIVIDSAKTAYEECIRFTCQRHFGKDYPTELPEKKIGNAWARCAEAYRQVFRALKLSGVSVVFLGHSTELEREDPLGIHSKATTTTIKASAGCRDFLLEITDFFWFLSMNGKDRVLTVRADQHADIKTQRRGHFLNPKGEPLRQILIPNVDSDDDPVLYQTILDGWNNKLWDYSDDPEDEEEEPTPVPTVTRKKATKARTVTSKRKKR